MPLPHKKIALLGPESTGKSSLCRQLAAHYQAPWVPEFARDYLEALDRNYTLQDVIYCAGEQLKAEDLADSKSKGLLFCDTEFINYKIWCLDVFKTCPDWISGLAASKRYDFYLLTMPDIPFIADPVRENPHRREELFLLYKGELEQLNIPYATVGGTGDERLWNAVRAIDAYLNT